MLKEPTFARSRARLLQSRAFVAALLAAAWATVARASESASAPTSHTGPTAADSSQTPASRMRQSPSDSLAGPESQKLKTACLRWITDERAGCPSAEEVAASVESAMGRQVFVADNCDVRIYGEVALSPNEGWKATLGFSTRDGRLLGTRHLTASEPECSSLRGSASLVVALMLEASDTTIASTQAASPSSKSHASIQAVVPQAAARPSAPPAATLPWRERGYADVRGAYGLLPGFTLGTSLGLSAMLFDLIPSRFEGNVWLPKPSHPGPGGRFWGWHVGLGICPTLHDSERQRITLCVGGQSGAMYAAGRELTDTRTVMRPYAHAEARLAVSIPLGSAVALSPHIALAMPLVRPRFVYLDTTQSTVVVFQPNLGIVLGGIGLVWRDAKPTPAQSSSL